jgi:hypothetical protein
MPAPVQEQVVGTFAVTHVPVAATQATVTKAAGGAGVRLICNAISVSIACGATAQTPILAELLDGATQIWAAQLACPINDTRSVLLTDMRIMGSANTSMTLRFSGAGVANSIETVALSGYVEI